MSSVLSGGGGGAGHSGLSDPISAGRLSWKSPLLCGGERDAGRKLLGHPWYWLEHPVWLVTVARYPTLPCLLINKSLMTVRHLKSHQKMLVKDARNSNLSSENIRSTRFSSQKNAKSIPRLAFVYNLCFANENHKPPNLWAYFVLKEYSQLAVEP